MSARPVATDLKDLRALGSAMGLKGFGSPADAKPADPDPDVAELKALARKVGLKGFADDPKGSA